MKDQQLQQCLRSTPLESTLLARKLTENKARPFANKEKGDWAEVPLLKEIKKQYDADPDFFDSELVLNGGTNEGFESYIMHRHTRESSSDECKNNFSQIHRGNIRGNYYYKRAFRQIQGREITKNYETLTIFGDSVTEPLKQQLEDEGVKVIIYPIPMIRDSWLSEEERKIQEKTIKLGASEYLKKAKRDLGLKEPSVLVPIYNMYKVGKNKVTKGKLKMDLTFTNGDKFETIVEDEKVQLNDQAPVYSVNTSTSILLSATIPISTVVKEKLPPYTDIFRSFGRPYTILKSQLSTLFSILTSYLL